MKALRLLCIYTGIDEIAKERRQKIRETESQRAREPERRTDGQTDRQTDRKRERERERETGKVPTRVTYRNLPVLIRTRVVICC